jgi:hypothetical protein
MTSAPMPHATGFTCWPRPARCSPNRVRTAAALDVEINLASLEDAGRERHDLDPVDIWTAEAVTELLRRLDREGPVQSDVIREAAPLGGTVSREIVYGLCGYDNE